MNQSVDPLVVLINRCIDACDAADKAHSSNPNTAAVSVVTHDLRTLVLLAAKGRLYEKQEVKAHEQHKKYTEAATIAAQIGTARHQAAPKG